MTSSARSTFSQAGQAVGAEIVKARVRRTTTPAAPGHLHPHRGRPPPHRRLRPGHRPALRPRQDTKDRTRFLEFCRYLRTLYPPDVRIAIVLDNFSPHLSTKVDPRVGDWADANNVELAYIPTNTSWLNRIEAQFQALRYFALDGTDHRSHQRRVDDPPLHRLAKPQRPRPRTA